MTQLEKTIINLISLQSNHDQLVEIHIYSPIPRLSFSNILNQNEKEAKKHLISLDLGEDWLRGNLKVSESIASLFEKYNKEHQTQFRFRVVFDQK